MHISLKSYKNIEQLIRFIIKKKKSKESKRLTVQHSSKDWTTRKDPQALTIRRRIRFLAASSTILLNLESKIIWFHFNINFHWFGKKFDIILFEISEHIDMKKKKKKEKSRNEKEEWKKRVYMFISPFFSLFSVSKENGCIQWLKRLTNYSTDNPGRKDRSWPTFRVDSSVSYCFDSQLTLQYVHMRV